MSAVTLETLVARIHLQPTQLLLALTGGGSRAIAHLLEMPGGSRVLLEAAVPYAAAALDTWLGAPPENYCSARTARAMAAAGYQRALKLATKAGGHNSPPVAGVAATSSLASDRPKRGPHRAHVAWQTAASTAVTSLELNKGARTRQQEELLVAKLILNAVAAASGLTDEQELPLLPDEQPVAQRVDASAEWQNLLAGRNQWASGNPAAAKTPVDQSAAAPLLVFPGAFNPLHAGHRQMAAIAAARIGKLATLEISIENVDKPPLDFIEMQTRADRLANEPWPLLFTRAATFERKSALFPGATFVVGADTVERIAEPRYYANAEACQAALAAIAARGCRFLVFGRLAPGQFMTLGDLQLPAALREICDEVPAAEFRMDLSSTQLRAAGRKE